MNCRKFQKQKKEPMRFGVGRTTLPNVGPFAGLGTQQSSSQSNLTLVNTGFAHAAGTLTVPYKYNRIYVNPNCGIYAPEYALFFWANTVYMGSGGFFSVRGQEVDGTGSNQGGNGATGGSSTGYLSSGETGQSLGLDGFGGSPGIGYGAGSVPSPWYSSLAGYDIGTGGSGGGGGDESEFGIFLGGVGGVGARGLGGTGGSGAGCGAQPGQGSGGSAGCFVLACNELICNGSAFDASGSFGYCDSAPSGGAGGSGGGVIWIAARRKIGTISSFTVKGGQVGGFLAEEGTAGTDGTARIFAILPDDSLVLKSYTDRWNYL